MRGYYHFAYPDINDPEPEANQFLNAVGPLQSGEILCLDFERLSPDPVDWCARFLERINLATGIKPFLYINRSTQQAHNWARVIDGGFGLWLACPDGQADTNIPTTQWPCMKIKQYGLGNIGWLSSVDMDVVDGNKDDFQAWGAR